ncbi:MAG: methylenetetrahydrofolate reductase [Woeseia sp.]|nr:methylenetetrahydrofolate reductase [Woeseia sp.]MBT8097779.1 methylenetetrahydrofolate reductase [Woeseia sp.]NNE60524.1 methylenetetrahydrofolate reductase [Woeseia sp.]NNL54884.1 methylenetetrahydrofolate reductase [Woeseia sp.]
MPDDSRSALRNCLQSGHFAVTAELTPPRAAELQSLSEAAALLKTAVTAVNLTDGAGARVRMSSLAAAIHLRQQGIEPILQVTCRDRNRIAIQSDLLGAAAFGINNVLVISGDGIREGDDATPVFDFNSRTLLAAIKKPGMSGDADAASSPTTSGNFFCGTADMPCEPPTDWVPDALLAKQRAGADFVQTQYCFDIDLLRRYIGRLADHGLTEQLYFLVGLGPLRSADGARWMRDNLFGTVMPDGIIRRMEAARDPREEGIEICAELMQEARDIPGVAGVHLMAPGNHTAIVAAVQLAGLI